MKSPAHDRFQLQDSQYEFPYHYIPHIAPDGGVSAIRVLGWGVEYLAYQTYVARMIHALRPSSVLDVGCGDGRLLGTLSDDIPLRMGVDLSSRAIAFARAFNPDVRFECMDTRSMTMQFDVVTAIEVLEHIPYPDVTAFLLELRRLVRPGGALLISVPTTAVPLNPKHYRHYDVALLAEQLAAAGMACAPEDVHHVFRPSLAFQVFRAITINRWWVLEFRILRKLIWSHVMRRCLTAPAGAGRHLVVRVRL